MFLDVIVCRERRRSERLLRVRLISRDFKWNTRYAGGGSPSSLFVMIFTLIYLPAVMRASFNSFLFYFLLCLNWKQIECICSKLYYDCIWSLMNWGFIRILHVAVDKFVTAVPKRNSAAYQKLVLLNGVALASFFKK